MKKEFAGTLLSSFGMMGSIHFSLEMPGSLVGDTNQFLQGSRGKACSGHGRDPGGGSLSMCRPCSEALASTRACLREISDRLKGDEYDIHNLPVDLCLSFKVLAEMARMMHLPELDREIEALAKAILDQVEPLNADLAESALEVRR